VFYNQLSSNANFAQFCYGNMVIKFVVSGRKPPSAPFDSNYTIMLHSPWGDGQTTMDNMKAKCQKAILEGADMAFEANTVCGNVCVNCNSVDCVHALSHVCILLCTCNINQMYACHESMTDCQDRINKHPETYPYKCTYAFSFECPFPFCCSQ
jgi:hypothetical protein